MARKYNHYFKNVAHLEALDVYRVLQLFGVTDPCLQHAIKKLLCAGVRGVKDQSKDIREAIDTLNRSLEMQQEDSTGVVKVETQCKKEFGSTACGYSGDRRIGGCDGSFRRCEELKNTENFGA